MKIRFLLSSVILLAVGGSAFANHDFAFPHPNIPPPKIIEAIEPDPQTHTFPALDTVNVFTNTNTFSGALNAKNINNVVQVSNGNPQGWSGTTPDAWLVSAAGTGNVTIDARGLTGNLTFAGTVALPANTEVYFGSLVTFTCSVSPCISYNNQDAIIGAGANSTNFVGAGVNGLSGPLIAPANSAVRTFDAIFRDFYMDNKNNATAGGVCIDYSNLSRARTYNVGCANAAIGYKVGGTIASFYNEFASTWCLTPATCYNIATNGNSSRISGGHSNGVSTTCINIDGATDTRILAFDAEQCVTAFNIGATTATSGTGIQHVRVDTGITTGFNISANASRTVVLGVYPAGVTTLLVDNATDTEFFVAHGDGHSPNFDVNKVRFGSLTTEFALLYCQAAGTACFLRNPTDTGYGTLDASFSLPAGTNFSIAAPLMLPTAPTIAAAGCGGAAASIVVANGTAAFKVNVGTTPTSACTLTFPAATTGWNVTCNDITTQSTSVFVQKQTGVESTTSVTITNFNDVAVATAFVASDILKCTAAAD